VLNGLAGGWQFNGNLTLQSGFPVDFPNAAPVAARSAKLSNDERQHVPMVRHVAVAGSRYRKSIQAQAPFTLRTSPPAFPTCAFPI